MTPDDYAAQFLRMRAACEKDLDDETERYNAELIVIRERWAGRFMRFYQEQGLLDSSELHVNDHALVMKGFAAAHIGIVTDIDREVGKCILMDGDTMLVIKIETLVKLKVDSNG